MEKELTLTIKKSDVITDVAQIAAYIGVKITTKDGGNVYDYTSIVDEDWDVLDRYFKEGCNEVAKIRKEYVKSMSFNENADADCSFVITYKATFPDPWPFEDNLILNVRRFLENFILVKWLNFTNAVGDYSAIYAAQARLNKDGINTLLGIGLKAPDKDEQSELNTKYGDIIESFTNEDGDDTGSEGEGTNKYGDMVDSFVNQYGDESEGEDESAMSIGCTFPQNSLKLKAECYKL